MHMMCTSMPILASTNLTEFLLYFVSQKILNPFSEPPSAGARGQMHGHMPLPPTRRYWEMCPLFLLSSFSAQNAIIWPAAIWGNRALCFAVDLPLVQTPVF